MTNTALEQKIERLKDRLDTLGVLSRVGPDSTQVLSRLLDSIDGEVSAGVENANRVLELTTLNNLSQALTAALEVEQILKLLYEHTALLMEIQNFYVALYDAHSDTISFPFAVEAGELQEPVDEWAPRKAGRGLTEYVFRHRGPLFIPNCVGKWMHEHQDEVDLIGQPAESWLGVPMIAAGQVIGVITVQDYQEKDTYDQHDLNVLSTIASQAAIAIVNARLFQSTQKQVEEFRLLREVGETITSTIEPQEVLLRVVQGARRVLDADIAAIYALDKGEFQPPVMDGELQAHHTLEPTPSEGGIAVRVLEERLIAIADLEKEPKMRSQFTTAEGVRSFAAVALEVAGQVVDGELVGGEPVGVLYVNFRNLHSFTDDERDILRLFATQAAVGIQNARLFEKIRLELERRIEELDALVEIDEAITTSDLDTVLDRVIGAACRIVGAPNGNITLLDSSREYLELRAIRGAPWVEDAQARFKIGEHGVTGWVAEHKKSALIPDVQMEEWRDRYIKALPDTQSELATPLLDENYELLGVINLESPNLRAFTEGDQRLLEALARQTVIAIQNQERYEAEQRARRELEILGEIDRAISSTLELDKVLQLILVQGLELVNAPSGTVMLYDKVKGDLWMAAEQGVMEEHKGVRHSLQQGIVGRAARDRAPLRIADITKPPWADIHLEYISKTRSELAVPILRDGRLIGVINAESPGVGAFSQADERLFVALAAQAVIAIQNAEQYQRLEAFREIDRTIISTLDRNQVLSLILDSALQLIGAEIGELRLLDRATDELVLRYSRIPDGLEVDAKWTRIPSGQGVTGWCIEQRQPAIVVDAEQDSRYIPYFRGMRSEVATPLLPDGEVLGVVSLESPQVGAFDEDDLKWLELLAVQAVIALQRLETLQARQEAEKRAAAAETMSEIGQEAFELAHRLGNDLGLVKSYANNVRSELEAQDVTSPSIVGELDNIVRDVQQVLDWSTEFRQKVADFGQVEPVSVPTEVLLEDAARAVTIPSSIEVCREVADDVARVCVVPDQVTDALRNLIANAVDAMPKGGTLTLRARTVERYVELEVEDTGVGIPQERQSRIFDLFYSTKGSSGFGLWSARRNALANGGDLRVKSQAGQGATFTILLPKA